MPCTSSLHDVCDLRLLRVKQTASNSSKVWPQVTRRCSMVFSTGQVGSAFPPFLGWRSPSQNVKRHPPGCGRRGPMVRVLSFSGHILQTLPLSKFSRVGDFAEHVAALLNAPNCSLVGKSGVKFQEHLPIEESGLNEEDEVTAVAETLDPLLQMLELQDADGTLSWDNLEELQDAALRTEQSLLECACSSCSIDGDAMPCLEWLDQRVPPPPMFCEDGPSYCTLSLDTPVIHGGARVLVFPDPSDGSRVAKVYSQETSMTIREVLRIGRSRPDLELLRGDLQPGEVLKPTISVTSHSRHEICLQLGHVRYAWLFRNESMLGGHFEDCPEGGMNDFSWL